MTILNRLEKLEESSNSLQLVNKVKLFKEYYINEGSKLSDIAATKTLLYLLENCTDKDEHLSNFIISESKLLEWDKFHLSEIIMELSNTNLYKNDLKLSYILENFKANLVNGVSECLLVKPLLSVMESYNWSNDIKSITQKLEESYNSRYNDILLYETYTKIYQTGEALYKDLLDTLVESYKQGWNLDTLKSNTKTWNFLSEMIDLYSNFKSDKKEIQSNNNVKVSPLFVVAEINESSKEYLYILESNKHCIQNFITLESNKIELTSSNDVSNLSTDFKHFTSLIESSNINLEHLQDSTLIYYNKNHTLKFKIDENDCISVLINDELLESDNILESIKYKSGSFYNESIINDCRLILKYLPNIIKVDESYNLESKFNDQMVLSYIKLNENNYTLTFDRLTGDRLVESYQTVTSLVNYVKESINYDLTDTFLRHLDDEKVKIDNINNNRKAILENIKELDAKKIKLVECINSGDYDNSTLNQALDMINEKIQMEREEYNKYETLK